jgi:hypothetical protein
MPDGGVPVIQAPSMSDWRRTQRFLATGTPVHIALDLMFLEGGAAALDGLRDKPWELLEAGTTVVVHVGNVFDADGGIKWDGYVVASLIGEPFRLRHFEGFVSSRRGKKPGSDWMVEIATSGTSADADAAAIASPRG